MWGGGGGGGGGMLGGLSNTIPFALNGWLRRGEIYTPCNWRPTFNIDFCQPTVNRKGHGYLI